MSKAGGMKTDGLARVENSVIVKTGTFKPAFATVKSTTDNSNSSNTVLLFLKYTNRQNRSITGNLGKP
jgi:hypothetical protein